MAVSKRRGCSASTGAALAAKTEREHEFTHAASHELRTPLTVIRVARDLIEQDIGLSEASRRSLVRIQGAIGEMENILDALLLLARSDDCVLENMEFSVCEVMAVELDRIQPAVQAKGLTLQWEQAAAPILHAPPRVLQVIASKLLANAVRFTDHGEIRVRVLADRVQVEDTGLGMDAQALAHAHAPFYCARTGTVGGPGLGLSVAHRLGQRCGWAIHLESEPAQGTRASIIFAAQQ